MSKEVFDVELTDTFNGEANYSWVQRRTIILPKGAKQAQVMRAAKRAMGCSGVNGRTESNGDEEYTFRPYGTHTIMFVTYRYIPMMVHGRQVRVTGKDGTLMDGVFRFFDPAIWCESVGVKCNEPERYSIQRDASVLSSIPEPREEPKYYVDVVGDGDYVIINDALWQAKVLGRVVADQVHFTKVE